MPLNQPIVSLLCEPAADDRLVAVGPGAEARRRSQLLQDVFALAHELSGDAGRRWLVETEDAYRVAVAILAAAVVRARVALPPNLQPGTLEELRAGCDRVLVSQADTMGADPLSPGAERAKPGTGTGFQSVGAPRQPARVDRDAPLVELFTSGTSGPGKLVTKALRHLEDEVVELERTLGGGIGPHAVVLATVSAHHLYGLLFRVLWPLAAGRPFARASFLLPDELLARVGQSEGAVVVSSPAHLRHLAASPRLGEQAARIRAVFSSGGPLESRTALDLESATGLAPVEIFGSTETGGVAWRRTCRADPLPRWTLLPQVGIEIAEDDRLVVSSPFVTAPASGDSRWCMGDRAEPDGEGFRLLGRSDRIAKVGEKTLLLPEIEQRLAGHDFVEKAVVDTYRDRNVQRLGALVVLSGAGRRRLAEDGRRALQAALASHLASRWDRVALPRRWRFLDTLPADARGKMTKEAFEAALARPAAECREPLVVSQSRDGDDHLFELVVPRDLPYFDGHYEAFALVPGAVQLEWVVAALGRLLGRPVSAKRMEAIKFRNVIRPAQALTLRLRVEGDRAVFTLADGERVFSSGRMTLAA